MLNRNLHYKRQLISIQNNCKAYALKIIFSTILIMVLLTACTPTTEGNVLGYLIAQRLGTLEPESTANGTGTLIGQVTHEGDPVPQASVIVAGRTGLPYTVQTDENGQYEINGIPPGQYVPSVVGVDFQETVPTDFLGTPRLVTIKAGQVIQAPTLELKRHDPVSLPDPLLPSVQLSQTANYTTTSPFPPDSAAQVYKYQFQYAGATVDTLRLYLPLNLEPDQQLPLFFIVYPGIIDGWESISVAYAAQGFGVVAISPIADRVTDVDAHAQDARVAFALARSGALTSYLSPEPAVSLGGSFTSAVLHRFLRDEGDQIAAWVTVGGIGNAFRGTADFYAGNLLIPPEYEFLIPALGRPNLHPLNFLRYSPIYTAQQLPPTLIIHTDIDRIVPISQAYELEEALRVADVPVEVFYYEDVSHYLQIDENMSSAGEEMFYLIADFVRRYSTP